MNRRERERERDVDDEIGVLCNTCLIWERFDVCQCLRRCMKQLLISREEGCSVIV